MAHHTTTASVPMPPETQHLPTPSQSANRKKQKRHAKAAAAASAAAVASESAMAANSASTARHGTHAHGPDCTHGPHPHKHDKRPRNLNPADQYTDDENDLEAEVEMVFHAAQHPGFHPHDPPMARGKQAKRPRHASRNMSYGPDPSEILNTAMSKLHLPNPPLSSLPNNTIRSITRSARNDRIWNTSTQEERERIKEFWLSLSEDERKSLLKIEKDAVLRKMKEQQKHSCSCTVCGRKRTAIEEELEVLYDAYYDELEQYANIQHHPPLPSSTAHHSLPPPPPPPRAPNSRAAYYPPPLHTHARSGPRTSRIREVLDTEEHSVEGEVDVEVDVDDQDDDECYSDEYEDESYEEDAYEPIQDSIGAGFFDFGNSLTVKGGILTVADDLLQNDGRKFIEMMEQLAERRMQREQDAEYAKTRPIHHPPPVELPMEEEDEYEDDEDYDSQEEYEQDYEVDEMGGMTEEQRMEEGRRMFQIFAARMFEQRVLTAYREKVAAERQQKLLEELEDESLKDAQRKDKKLKDAEKKKNKKLAQKQAKAEAEAKKAAEKAEEEAVTKAEAERLQAEQREKRDAQRKEAQAKKKAQEEERQRKEDEKLRRQREEKQRQEAAALKARQLKEQKAEERKKQEEEQRKAKETKDKEAQAQRAKAHEDERLKEASKHDHVQQQQQQPQAGTKAQTQMKPATAFIKQTSTNASPHLAVATPVMPKAGSQVKPRQGSRHESWLQHPASPLTISKGERTSPTSLDGAVPRAAVHLPPKHSMPQHPLQHQQQHTFGHPPGPVPFSAPGHGQFVPQPYAHGHGNAHAHAQVPSRLHGQQSPMQAYRMHQQLPMGQPHGNVMMPQPPGFPSEPPPGMFQPAPIGAPGHVRQGSASEKGDLRPNPIQRPLSSMQPDHDNKHGNAMESDDINRHLGSSALLDDADEPLPRMDGRKFSNPPGMGRTASMGFSPPLFTTMPGPPAFNSQNNWSSPKGFATAGPMWGNTLNNGSLNGLNGNNGWSSAHTFGAPQRHHQHSSRPLAIRLAVCQACRQLAASTNEAYHDVQQLLGQIDMNGSLPDGPPSLKEIEEICETEGDAQNGGGSLSFRRTAESSSVVHFEPGPPSTVGSRPPAGQIGEIGSPVSPQTMAGAGAAFGQAGRGALGSLGADLTPSGGF